MDDNATSNLAAGSIAPPNKPSLVKRLLSRKPGATLAERSDATAWQPHSVRAHISGLRKKGATILLEPRSDGMKSYRLIQPDAGATSA